MQCGPLQLSSLPFKQHKERILEEIKKRGMLLPGFMQQNCFRMILTSGVQDEISLENIPPKISTSFSVICPGLAKQKLPSF
jgi:hypothetical protein